MCVRFSTLAMCNLRATNNAIPRTVNDLAPSLPARVSVEDALTRYQSNHRKRIKSQLTRVTIVVGVIIALTLFTIATHPREELRRLDSLLFHLTIPILTIAATLYSTSLRSIE